MTFLESIAIADMEKIHSQIIAFIFSDTCTCISTDNKRKMLEGLFRVNNLKTKTFESFTEYSFVDILIVTEDYLFVIENKLKSNQYSDQLKTYKEKIEGDKNLKALKLKNKYCFLTFAEEEANIEIKVTNKGNDQGNEEDAWNNISYAKFSGLFLESYIDDTKENAKSLRDYKAYLKELILVLTSFDTDHKKFQNVFMDASARKYVKIWNIKKLDGTKKAYSDQQKFVSRNNLESILQWRFFKRNIEKFFNENNKKIILTHPEKRKNDLVWEIEGTKYKVFLSRSGNGGNVVMDITWGDVYKFDGIDFIFCFQFQGSAIKFGFHADDYSNVSYDNLPKGMREYFVSELKGVNKHDKFNPAKTGKKTFMSVSRTYKLQDHDDSKIRNDIHDSFIKWEIYYEKNIKQKFINELVK